MSAQLAEAVIAEHASLALENLENPSVQHLRDAASAVEADPMGVMEKVASLDQQLARASDGDRVGLMRTMAAYLWAEAALVSSSVEDLERAAELFSECREREEGTNNAAAVGDFAGEALCIFWLATIKPTEQEWLTVIDTMHELLELTEMYGGELDAKSRASIRSTAHEGVAWSCYQRGLSTEDPAVWEAAARSFTLALQERSECSPILRFRFLVRSAKCQANQVQAAGGSDFETAFRTWEDGLAALDGDSARSDAEVQESVIELAGLYVEVASASVRADLLHRGTEHVRRLLETVSNELKPRALFVAADLQWRSAFVASPSNASEEIALLSALDQARNKVLLAQGLPEAAPGTVVGARGLVELLSVLIAQRATSMSGQLASFVDRLGKACADPAMEEHQRLLRSMRAVYEHAAASQQPAKVDRALENVRVSENDNEEEARIDRDPAAVVTEADARADFAAAVTNACNAVQIVAARLQERLDHARRYMPTETSDREALIQEVNQALALGVEIRVDGKRSTKLTLKSGSPAWRIGSSGSAGFRKHAVQVSAPTTPEPQTLAEQLDM